LWIREYSDAESAIRDTAGVVKAGLLRYMVSETVLGIEEDIEEVTF